MFLLETLVLGPDGTAFESQTPWRLMQKNHLFQVTIGYRVSSVRAWATWNLSKIKNAHEERVGDAVQW